VSVAVRGQFTRHFRDLYRKLVPSWLQDPDEGAPLLYSLGAMADVFVERARLGLLARYPQHAPSDALSLIGRDRRIARGIAETDAAYAARLLTWLDDHRVRGNPFALLRQLRAYCQADVRVRTVDARGNWYTIDRDGTRSFLIDGAAWNWDDADASRWSRFWVIIYPTAGGEPWSEGPAWGDPGLVWGDPTRTWGTTATPQQVADVRRIVRDWKPAGTRCEHIIIAFDDASFAPDGSSGDLPDGTWGQCSTTGSVRAKARLATARYWPGTRAT
jgi:hypothetical protein